MGLSRTGVSDWNAIGELIPHGIAIDGEAAARKAFVAGVDMDMVSSLYHDNLLQIVSSRQATTEELDEAVRHVLRVKLALGLLEHPFVDEGAAAKALYHPKSIALAQTAAERSFVLLKNASGPDGKALLPLATGTENIAVIGPLRPEAFAIWNDRNEFAAEPAKVKVWISPDSAHGSAAEAEIQP